MAFILRGFATRNLSLIKPTCARNDWPQVIGTGCHFATKSGKPDEREHQASSSGKREEKRRLAKLKLNELLESIQKEGAQAPAAEAAASESGVSGRLAKPGGRPRPREVVPAPEQHAPDQNGTKKQLSSRQPTLDEQVAEAAREVAASLGGDSAQTEMELLLKLTGEQSDRPQDDRLQLSELMSSMKVEQRPEEAAPALSPRQRHQLGERRADAVRQVRRDGAQAARRPPGAGLAAAERVDLRAPGEGLGIFTELKQAAATEMTALAPSVWDCVHERELRLAVTHPAANPWEEMALWTEQGKLWHLPVDNEQGLDEEAAVGFHEHVFLEGCLEPWCPPRGPIRHFMELVCVALGKNPWLSVQEKHDHLAWFRDYFAGKQKLLKELKAM